MPRSKATTNKNQNVPHVARKASSRANFPEWIQPMAATLTQARFTGFIEWTVDGKLRHPRLLAVRCWDRGRPARK